MECTQVLFSESFDVKNAVTEKIPVATLLIDDEYHTIYNTENVIGRENSCDIVISNSAVSSKHAIIEAEDSDAHLIYDLGSTNKTKLGKMVLKPHVRYHINDGDSVTFGNVSAQYNMSRKYVTTPLKGNASLNSYSIPETPERLTSTLELTAGANGKQKIDSSLLELSDTDLFDEKEADDNLCPKEIPDCLSKTSSDIYELDTLSFDENIENCVKKTVPIEESNKISGTPAKKNVEVDSLEVGSEEKPTSKVVSNYDKDRAKNNFGWDDFPEIAYPVRVDSSSADNLDCPKPKISSSFLDITNDDLKSDQHIPKNIGGVILSDLCKPGEVDSSIVVVNKQDLSSPSKESEFKIVDEAEKESCSENTSTEPKNHHTSELNDGKFSENDCYIPMSQNIDMFDESPEKTMNKCPEQSDVYEMLTQVSVDNKEVINLNNSIYDLQTQVVIADNDPESKVDKENESSFILSPNKKLFSILEPATQPSEDSDEERTDSSYLKAKVIDETDNNCSFSASLYEADTEPCFKEPFLANHNQVDENMDFTTIKKQDNGEKNCNLSDSELCNLTAKKIDQNESISSTVVEVATQPCTKDSVEKLDSVQAESSNKTDKNEYLSTTIIKEGSQLHSEEISIDPNAKDTSICDWYEIATQPCPPASGNVMVIEQEIQRNELSKNNGEELKAEAVENSSISVSTYEIATQPCTKDIPSEKMASINETTLRSESTIMNDENNKDRSFSASICEIATQSCPKDIFLEKTESANKTIFNSDVTVLDNENNKDSNFSASICEIATQPCPKDIFPEKTESIDRIILNSDFTIVDDEKNKDRSFSASLCEIATQPCPKDILPEKTESISGTFLNPDVTTVDDENNKDSSFSASMCEIATQPYPKDIFPEKIESTDKTILNSDFTLVDDKKNKESSFSASFYEISTQPCPKDNSPEKSESINKNILNSDLSTMNKENNDNIPFSTSICEIATQPYPKDIFHEKTESINRPILNFELTMMNDENNENNISSTDICEIATQPCPNDIVLEKIQSINKTSLNSDFTVLNDENDKDRSFSASMCQIATQPCSKDIFPGKAESINENNLNSELTMMNDRNNQNNTFSASICEIATQPCLKDIFHEKNEPVNGTILNSDFTVADDENNKDSRFSASKPEIATQPFPKEIFPEKTESISKNILNSKLTTMNNEDNDNTSSTSICEIETQPCRLTTAGISDESESNKNISNLHEGDAGFKEIKAPQVGNEIKMIIDPIMDSTNNFPSNDENLPKVSETGCEIENVLIKVPNAKSDVDLEKRNNIEVTHKPKDITFTATLPNVLSDSFFEAATQPYKNDLGEDKTFPDPLTSICNDLTDEKIGEITDELMYGNISVTLEEKNKLLHNNNSNKESNKLRNNVETSDHNIYEALTDQVPFSSRKNLPSNSINSENPHEKISTQDLQRILESDDLTQKYDEFKKTIASSTTSGDILKSKLNDGLHNESEHLLNSETKEPGMESVPDVQALGGKVMFLDSDSSQELNIRSNKNSFNVFPSDSQSFTHKFLDNEDSSQELNFRSNKKRASVFPPDSQSFTNKFLDSEDSSQELNFRSNKRRANIFPSDSQSFTNKFLDNEDSSQELNIRSNKKRCNVFPPDSQSFANKFLDNEDSSQELNIKSNKKRCNVFPPDSQDCIYKNLETESNPSEKICVETQDQKSAFNNIVSFNFIDTNLIKNNDIQKPNDDVSSNIVSNTSVENDDQSGTKQESMSLNNKLDATSDHQAHVPKGKLCERIPTSGKRNSKDAKNKSPPERERESTYISRGNITLHSPEVLSELEEQFRLTKVAMSPTQLSVVSDIDDDVNSSQEINELDKQGIRRSIRNRKNVLSTRSPKNNKSPVSHKLPVSAAAISNENLLKDNENKRKEANSFSVASSNEKSFKKFKKVSPLKNNSPTNEKLVTMEKVTTNEANAEIVCNNSDNSQNSEELGRGKRKRTRTSYEGFIIEEEKKRTSRKKLSFSNSEESENMNSVSTNTEEINIRVLDGSLKNQNLDVLQNNIKQTVSVALIDIQKVSTEVTEPKVEQNRMSKKKAGSLSKENEASQVLVDKISNPSSSSRKDEAKSKQNETFSKDKNSSFSFSEKLDELFNIWGPADRVKLSPRVAKKSYKLLAEGKTESASPRTNAKTSNTSNTSDTEPKPATSKSKKNSFKTNEKKNEAMPVVVTSAVSTNRKRNLSQKNEVTELSDGKSKQNKKRRKTNSENSENSLEADMNDHDTEVRKSSRITRKKIPDIPVPDSKLEKNTGQSGRTSNELPKRKGNRSTESIEDSALVSNKVVKANLRNSGNSSMKPPLNTTVVNVKNKNLKTKEKKNHIHNKENPSLEIHEENYCFSQEFSFHEKKIEKGKRNPSNNTSNPPLIIRRSGRKKNENTAEKNVENVMFTGFADKKTKSLVSVLGGQIVESPFTCTVLVTDKIRRTTKFLSALSRGLPIVSPEWLIDSNENGRFLDASDFLLSDNEAETMFSFNLKKSIEKAQKGKLLDGWAVFVTPSVKPSPEEMKSIIECSGGRFLPKELTRWPVNSLIVSCGEDRAMWPKFSKKGKTPIIVDNEAILLGVLRQELDLESHKLL